MAKKVSSKRPRPANQTPLIIQEPTVYEVLEMMAAMPLVGDKRLTVVSYPSNDTQTIPERA